MVALTVVVALAEVVTLSLVAALAIEVSVSGVHVVFTLCLSDGKAMGFPYNPAGLIGQCNVALGGDIELSR